MQQGQEPKIMQNHHCYKQLNHGGKEGEHQIRAAVVCPSVHRDLIKQPDGNNIFTGFVLVVF